MYFLKEFQEQPTQLSDLLLWGGMIDGPAPAIILNKDGALMTTLRYQAPDVEMLGTAQRRVYLQRLNRLLMRLGTGWAILADEWHEPATAYPASTGQHPTAAFVDATQRALHASGVLHEPEQFLTLTWMPPNDGKEKWYDRFAHQRARRRQLSDLDRHLDSLRYALQRWSDGLSGLWQWHWCSPDETVTYLHRCISWNRYALTCPEIPMYLDTLLPDMGFLPGYTPQLGERFLRPICVKTWPRSDPETGQGGLGWNIPALLQHLPFSYRYTERALMLDKTDARAMLKDYEGKWGQSLFSAGQYVANWARGKEMDENDPTQKVNQEVKQYRESIRRAQRSVDADECTYGIATPMVTVWGETPEELEYREREVCKLFQQQGMIMIPETVNAPAAWLGGLPGDTYHNRRGVPISSDAIGWLLPHGSIWTGPLRDENYEADPLFVASSDGVPFRCALHPTKSELGHTVVLGPSRGGKSALLAWIMSQFLHRYPGAQIICFDKDYALYPCTVLHGGLHYDLGGADSLGLQPLGRGDLGTQELRWQQGWVEKLITSQHVRLEPGDSEQIWEALRRQARMPVEFRTLTMFRSFLQESRLKEAFAPFVRGEAGHEDGPYAFLDADHDTMAMSEWTTFEMRKLLEMEAALPHVLRYRFHRIAERLDGRPTLISIDEVRKLLQDPVFGPEILDFLLERAKAGVNVLLSFQEVAHYSKSVAAEAIFSNTVNWFFLPNDMALTDQVQPYYEMCGLTEEEIHRIALATPRQDYLYKSPIGRRLFQLKLTPLQRALLAASTPEEIATLRRLLQEQGKEPLVSRWLRTQDLEIEANIFRDHYWPKEVAA